MSAAATRPAITPVDRFGLTLCLAVIAHAIVVLGIGFSQEDRDQPRFDTMEIILVQQKDPVAPEQPDLLAQASLEGGGEVSEEVSPATPLPPPFPDNKPEIAAPPPSPPTPVDTVPAPQQPASEPLSANPAAQELVAVTADKGQLSKQPAPPEPETQTQKEAKRKPTSRPDRPSAAALLTNSFKIASLSAEIKRKLEAKAKRPRRKFISASTQEYKYAAYMEAWRTKVERVGNLNYPDEARRRKLSGNLVLDVALNTDGTVNQITIRRSSGYTVLDDAAIRIVRLAAPYSPFPDSIRKDTDILHITRTWQFINNRGFR